MIYNVPYEFGICLLRALWPLGVASLEKECPSTERIQQCKPRPCVVLDEAKKQQAQLDLGWPLMTYPEPELTVMVNESPLFAVLGISCKLVQ